uniref:Uncharacterized protein n=1 Tax=Arundo donax TaxID=35708 RepID=A0A0A9HGP4_ARUDO
MPRSPRPCTAGSRPTLCSARILSCRPASSTPTPRSTRSRPRARCSTRRP